MRNRPKIKLDSGVEIWLGCLFQYRTYGGLLEGLPTEVERNLAFSTPVSDNQESSKPFRRSSIPR